LGILHNNSGASAAKAEKRFVRLLEKIYDILREKLLSWLFKIFKRKVTTLKIRCINNWIYRKESIL